MKVVSMVERQEMWKCSRIFTARNAILHRQRLLLPVNEYSKCLSRTQIFQLFFNRYRLLMLSYMMSLNSAFGCSIALNLYATQIVQKSVFVWFRRLTDTRWGSFAENTRASYVLSVWIVCWCKKSFFRGILIQLTNCLRLMSQLGTNKSLLDYRCMMTINRPWRSWKTLLAFCMVTWINICFNGLSKYDTKFRTTLATIQLALIFSIVKVNLVQLLRSYQTFLSDHLDKECPQSEKRKVLRDMWHKNFWKQFGLEKDCFNSVSFTDYFRGWRSGNCHTIQLCIFDVQDGTKGQRVFSNLLGLNISLLPMIVKL